MKGKSEVNTNGKAVFYAVLYNSFRQAALECGYALSLHGSMISDMDLIAVAWTEDANPVNDLIQKISDCIGKTVWKDHHFKEMEHKPNGRIVYTLSIMGDWFIDLSIIPPMDKNVFLMHIINETATDFATSIGISEQRRIDLSKQMDYLSKRNNRQTVRTCNIFNEIIGLCKNIEEVVYCTHTHTLWLIEKGYMAYVN
jgi:hypothetical protein